MEVRIKAHLCAFYQHVVPTYRIWVNDNLYTEREFWINPLEDMIVENIIVEIEPGEHTITLEKVRPRNREWVWIERLLIVAGNNNYDIGFELKKQDKQVIPFKITE